MTKKLPEIYSLDELVEKEKKDLAGRIANGRWGRWRLDKACDALWFDKYGDGRDEGNAYWIPLDGKFSRHGGAENWIWHLQQKKWVEDADLGAFIRAILDLRSAGIISFVQFRG